jgi:hypothetical protein
MTFKNLREIRLSLLVGCDNRDYCYYRDYRFYKIDRDNPCCFDETCLQNISRNNRGRFAAFQRVADGTMAVEGTEGHRGDIGLQRRQRAVERTLEGTEGHRGKKVGPLYSLCCCLIMLFLINSDVPRPVFTTLLLVYWTCSADVHSFSIV